MQIHKPYSAAELNVIIKVMEVECLSPKVRRKPSNYVSSVETFSDMVVMIFFLPAHVKHVLFFVSLSVVFTGLMVFFYMHCRCNVLRNPIIGSMGLAKLTHLRFERCYEVAYGQSLGLSSCKALLSLDERSVAHNLSLTFSSSLRLHNKISLISFVLLPFLVFSCLQSNHEILF